MSAEFIFYSQQEAEKVSILHESWRIPDIYYLGYQNSKIISPLNGRPVENIMQLDTEIDRQEMAAFRHLQSWVGQNSEGVAFLVFPPHFLRSRQAKVIVSELSESHGEKRLLNRAVLFDATPISSIDIANQLADIFSEQELSFDSAAQVRSTPIFTPRHLSVEEWLESVQQIVLEQAQWDMTRTGGDWKQVNKTLETLRSGGSISRGDNPLSCPLVLSPGMVLESFSLIGKFVKRCGNSECKVKIERIMFKGDKCPRCSGVYQGC